MTRLLPSSDKELRAELQMLLMKLTSVRYKSRMDEYRPLPRAEFDLLWLVTRTGEIRVKHMASTISTFIIMHILTSVSVQS